MKYCWEYTDDYLEYRSSLGLDIRNPGYYIKDFSRYLRNTGTTSRKRTHKIDKF